jgi:hypothetical protein
MAQIILERPDVGVRPGMARGANWPVVLDPIPFFSFCFAPIAPTSRARATEPGNRGASAERIACRE